MSDDIKELVKRLRAFRPTYGWPEEQATVVMQPLGDDAADALEAMEGEVAAATKPAQLLIWRPRNE